MKSQIDIAMRIAADHLAHRRHRETHAICVEILKAEPRVADAWYFLGVIAAEHENHARACDLFDKAIGVGPATARHHADKARSLVALSRREDALLEAESAIATGNQSPRTLDTIGVVLSRLGLHERAVPFYRDATTREPGNAAFWYNLGAGLQFMGDFEAAEKFGDDAGDRAAGRQRGVGDDAHQAHLAAAIDQSPAGLRDAMAECGGGGGEGRCGAEAGAAEDRDGGDMRHSSPRGAGRPRRASG